MKFVKVVIIYPKRIAIQTEQGIGNSVPESERHLLQPIVEQYVRDRNLPGYIDNDGLFKKVE